MKIIRSKDTDQSGVCGVTWTLGGLYNATFEKEHWQVEPDLEDYYYSSLDIRAVFNEYLDRYDSISELIKDIILVNSVTFIREFSNSK